MDPSTILAYLKLPTKVLAGIALAAIGVLFLPESWVAATGLLSPPATGRPTEAKKSPLQPT
jgi:hypothetical protein